MREIKIGSVYKHFKNKNYLILDIVNDCESNNDIEYKKIVIYKALYGDFLTWARPLEMFASEVDREKYPEVNQKYRFEEVDIEDEDLKNIRKYIDDYKEKINVEFSNLEKILEKKELRK